MAKVVKNPSQMSVRKRPKPIQGYSGTHQIGKRKPDITKPLKEKGKKPGTGLDDYTLDLMKLS